MTAFVLPFIDMYIRIKYWNSEKYFPLLIKLHVTGSSEHDFRIFGKCLSECMYVTSIL